MKQPVRIGPRELASFLFPASEAEFPSLYSLPESIVRLRAATDQASLFKQSMHGEFREAGVVLSRDVPFFGNHYAPVFLGSFQVAGTQVVLRGQFGTKRWFVTYQCVGLIFLASLSALSLPVAIIRPREAWWVPLVFLGLVVLAAGHIRLWQWVSRGDVAWLSRRIGYTLGRAEDWPDPPPRPPGAWRRKWREIAGQ